MVRGVELSGSAAFVSVAGRHCVHCFSCFSLCWWWPLRLGNVGCGCCLQALCALHLCGCRRITLGRGAPGTMVLRRVLVSRAPTRQSGVFLTALPCTTTALANASPARRPSSCFLSMSAMRPCARRRGRTRTQWLSASWSTTALGTAVWARRSAKVWCNCGRLLPLRLLCWSVSGSHDAKRV